MRYLACSTHEPSTGKKKSQFQTAKKGAKKKRVLSTLPTHSQDDDVLIIGSSMIRHLAGELSKTHEVKSTGFVYPGSKCQRLTQVIPQTQSQNQPRKPNVVVMAGGTKNIAAGEFVTNICDNQIRNSDIRYRPTHPRQQSVPLCISAHPHQTRIMMRDKCTPVPQHLTKTGNMPQLNHLTTLPRVHRPSTFEHQA